MLWVRGSWGLGTNGGAILGRSGCYPGIITIKYGGFRNLEPVIENRNGPFHPVVFALRGGWGLGSGESRTLFCRLLPILKN
jgi:hypothetical protein